MQPIRISKLGEERRSLSSRILYRKFLYGSLAATLVFCLGFVLAPTLASEASAAVNVDFELSWLPSSLTLDPDVEATEAGGSVSDPSHGDVVFSQIIPTSRDGGVSTAASGNVGTLKILKKTIGIETTGRYYAVYLSTASTSNALAYNGDSLMSIPAINSSFATPAVFSNASWGYAIPGIENTGITSAPAYALANLYSSNLNEDLTYATAENIYSNVTFSPVPTKSSAQQIWKATTNNVYGFGGENGDTENNTFNIYYGVMADTSLIAGTYENSIIYTALASTADMDTVSTNLGRSLSWGTGGETQTLAFDLSSSVDGNTLSTSDLDVYVVKHSDMTAVNYDVTQLTTQSNKCAITAISTGSQVSLTCTMPNLSDIADYTADETTATGRAGRYDFWVNVKPYNLNYVSQVSDGASGTIEAFAYVGLQSRYKSASEGSTVFLPYVAKMQEVTGDICKNTNMWGTGSGDSARIYDYRGEVGNNPLLATGADTDGISSFILADTRDNKEYRVRRLADGNCWMVRNLNLKLADFVGRSLTNQDTDLNTKTSWAITSNIESSSWSTSPEAPHSIDTSNVTKGNFYNWFAATAGTGTISTVADTTINDSICPKNWQLPVHGSNTPDKSYAKLLSIYPNLTYLPFQAQSAGFYFYNSDGYSGSRIDYWTATAASCVSDAENTCAYELYIGTTINAGHSKRYGDPIRCVSRD